MTHAGWVVAVASLLVTGTTAAAQTAGSAPASDTLPRAPVYRLGPIEATVTRGALPAERVPFAISTIEATELHPATPAVDLHEVLGRVPGVVVGNRHNLAMDTRVVVRGFGARSAFGVRGVRLLLDGIPLTLPDGQATVTNVDPGSLGRVEVLRGPAAALYGNAAGGVIAMTSAEPPAEGLLEATMAAWAPTARATRPDSSGSRGTPAGAGSGTRGSWVFRTCRRTGSGTTRGRGGRGSMPGTGVPWGERTGVSVILNVATVPLAENPGALPLDSALTRPRMAWPQNVATGSSKEVAQSQGGASVTHDLGPARVEAAVHGLDRRMDNPLPFGRYIRLDRTGGGARVLMRAADDRATSWVVGVETQVQRDDRVERDNLAGEMGGELYQDRIDRVTSWAPFAFAQVAVHPRIALRAGGRYDAVIFDSDDRLGGTAAERSARRTLDAWSGSTGALVDLGAELRGWVSVSTWFQTPTTTELINVPPTSGEPCCQTGFNPELEPQDGWGWEAGIAGRRGAVDWEVVAFDLTVRNEIFPFQVEGIPGRDFYRNAGRSAHRGVELGTLASFRSGWSAALAYAVSDFRFTGPADPALTDNRLPGIPPHRVDGRVGWRDARHRLELAMEWVDRMPVDDGNADFAPSYTLVDLRAARTLTAGFGSVEPFLAITNLLDTRHSASVVINAFGGRYHEPGPGRALLTGVRARFR
jgi:iron complex outermembrane recepter protein